MSFDTLTTQLVNVRMRVNGDEYALSVEPRTTLADLLRESLALTATKVGCEHGVCGACTVLLEGRPVRSCLMLGVQADGRELTTLEGLSGGAVGMNALQHSFQRNHALQCGFCTAGILLSATALLAEDRTASRDEIREALSGHLCRCTGYETIVDAIEDAQRVANLDRVAVSPIDPTPEGGEL